MALSTLPKQRPLQLSTACGECGQEGDYRKCLAMACAVQVMMKDADEVPGLVSSKAGLKHAGAPLHTCLLRLNSCSLEMRTFDIACAKAQHNPVISH